MNPVELIRTLHPAGCTFCGGLPEAGTVVHTSS
jgi:hypothetical protein